MVLNDGETFTALDGCRVVEVPDGAAADEIEALLHSRPQTMTVFRDGAPLGGVTRAYITYEVGGLDDGGDLAHPYCSGACRLRGVDRVRAIRGCPLRQGDDPVGDWIGYRCETCLVLI